MDIKLLKEEIFKKAVDSGFSECEIYYGESNKFQVNIFESEITQYENTYSKALSFRGIYNGSMGHSYTERIDFEVIEKIIDEAKENAKIIEDEDKEILYEGDEVYLESNCYNENLKNFSVEEKIKMALNMESETLKGNEYVKSVDHCMLISGESKIYISNTKGLELLDKSNYAIACVYAIVEKDKQVKVAGEIWFDNDLNKFDAVKIAEKAVKKATSYLGASQPKSGKYGVIFNNTSASDLLSIFVSIFFAEKVHKGFSLLKEKLGVKIASDIVTLCDDGIYEGSLGNVSFDSEGVATKNKIVIDNGILKTYLYNLKSAKKDNTRSTGNGFRSSLSSIDTSCTNFYIKPSDVEQSEMLNNLDNGVLITEVAGLHVGANVISGDFSLQADGFLIKDGKISKPVEQIVVSGNFYTLLQNIVAVGNDLRFNLSSSIGTIGSPSIHVSELSISGGN